LAAAVLAGALLVGGGGAYLYTNGDSNFASGPSIIAADSSPIKEEPADPEGREFPNGNKLIYDRLGGEESGSSGARLASAEQAPAVSAESIPGLVTSGGSGTLEERIENALRAQGEGGADAKSPDAPRTVQTLTFSPDGSQQPVRPQAQSVTVDNGSDDALSSAIVVTGQSSGSTGNYGTTASPSAVETNSVNAVPAQNVQAEETQVASISPQAETAPISTGVGGTDNYFVQIGARNDPQAATEAFKKLQQRYAPVIGNYSPSLRKADLGAKGVWYRLWVGPVDNKVEAEALCEQLKQAGMKACLVRKDQ
jgi:cell division protein FtsN